MPRVKGKSRLQTGSPGSESCSSKIRESSS
jgi:hypothetical protein